MRYVGLRPDVFTYSAAIKAAGHVGRRWALALGFLVSARAGRLQPDVTLYNGAITACEQGFDHGHSSAGDGGTHNGDWSEEVVEVAALARSTAGAGVGLPGAGGQDPVLPELWEQALALLAELRHIALEPCIISYSAAMAACAKAGGGQWHRVIALLEEARGGALRPTSSTCGSTMTACANAGEWEQCLALLHCMESQQVGGPRVLPTPDTESFNMAIAASSRAVRADIAQALVGRLRHRGLRPDVVTASTAIGAFAASMLWEQALEQLSGTWRSGTVPNIVSFNAAASGLGAVGEWQPAMELLSRVRSLRQANALLFTSVLSACAEAYRWQEAVMLLQSEMQPGFRLDTESFTAVVSACERAHAWRHCLLLLRDAEAFHMAPNHGTYQCAIRACGCGRQPGIALNLMAAFRRRRLPDVDDAILNTGAWACEASSQPAAVLEMPPLPPLPGR